MKLELIGLAVGLALGFLCPWTVPAGWSLYVAAGLLAALDSALGGARARLQGQFKLGIFLSGRWATRSSRCCSPGWGRRSASPSIWRRWWCSERACSKTLRKCEGNY